MGVRGKQMPLYYKFAAMNCGSVSEVADLDAEVWRDSYTWLVHYCIHGGIHLS